MVRAVECRLGAARIGLRGRNRRAFRRFISSHEGHAEKQDDERQGISPDGRARRDVVFPLAAALPQFAAAAGLWANRSRERFNRESGAVFGK